jgi:hypothetical protein
VRFENGKILRVRAESTAEVPEAVLGVQSRCPRFPFRSGENQGGLVPPVPGFQTPTGATEESRLPLFSRACPIPSQNVGSGPDFLRSRPASNRSRSKPDNEHDYDFGLTKKLRDKGLFFQELADRGVDLVATEIIQPHVLDHFAAVIIGGADRERTDDPLLHSVAAV